MGRCWGGAIGRGGGVKQGVEFMFFKVKFVTVVGLNLKKECARGKGGGSSGG